MPHLYREQWHAKCLRLGMRHLVLVGTLVTPFLLAACGPDVVEVRSPDNEHAEEKAERAEDKAERAADKADEAADEAQEAKDKAD
jgi:hypothetical protein